ncbi:hypothetical protein M3Y95_00962600 [Aphelenchoides besseyi]|nr:hypothetical protein M3Y95_00962600 [Aphelenchoides besseyi]
MSDSTKNAFKPSPVVTKPQSHSEPLEYTAKSDALLPTVKTIETNQSAQTTNTNLNESPQRRSESSRQRLTNLLNVQRRRAQTHQQQTMSPIVVETNAKPTGGNIPSGSSTSSVKKQTKESNSSSTKKRGGLANVFTTILSSESKKQAPLRQEISVAKPISIIEVEKKGPERIAGVPRQVHGSKINHKQLEAKMHRRNRRLACFSTVCCFLTIGIVLAAIGVTAGGAYMALNRYLLLSAERAATLNGPWIMEQTQCFQTIGRVQIHVLVGR